MEARGPSSSSHVQQTDSRDDVAIRMPSPAPIDAPMYRFEVVCDIEGLTKQEFFKLLMTPEFDRFMRKDLFLGTTEEESVECPSETEMTRKCIYQREVDMCLLPFAQPAPTDGCPVPQVYFITTKSVQKKDFANCMCMFENSYLEGWHEYIPVEKGIIRLLDTPTERNLYAFTLVLNLELATVFGWTDGGWIYEYLGSLFNAAMTYHFTSSWETYVTALPGLFMKYHYTKKHGETALGL